MDTDSITILQANLDALSPVTRRALIAATASDLVQLHAGDLPSASIRTPSGRVVRLHSGRDPVTEADRFVESALGGLPGGAPSVVMVIGPGLGYILDAIERRAPDTRVIAIEPFAALATAMLERRDWREWIAQKRLTLLVGPDYAGAGDAGPLLDERAAAAASVIEHPVIAREFPDEVARARAVTAHIVRGARLNAETRRAFAGRYLLNTLKNLPALLAEADAAALRDVFAGVPAIVVAAGPSLDTALPRLRELQDRALIVAVDTTLRPLRKAGIRPHLVVAVDPSELNARHLLGLDETAGSWLVTEGSIDPRVLPQFAGRVFGFKVSDHEPWKWLRTQGVERGTLRAWGSVLTTAFDLAIHIGCDPIAFVGADLSFPGGVHYCRGTMNEAPENHDASPEVRAAGFEAALQQHQRRTSQEIDIHGAPIASTPQFVQFRDWLVSRAIEAAPRRVVNATGAGILHGERIVQGDLASLPLPVSSLDAAARLTGAWRAAVTAAAPVRQALEATLADRAAALPMAAWLEFGGDTASAGQITTAVDDAWRTPPTVTLQPRSRFTTEWRGGAFSAAATGGPSPSVQWQASHDEGATWSDLTGATSATLTLDVSTPAPGTQFRAVFTNRHGTATTAPAVVARVTPGAAGDFNGDGKPDLLWHHRPSGTLHAWFMDGAARIGHGSIDAGSSSPGARVVGVADFNGDGRPDLLWQDQATGALSVWCLDGLDRAGVSEVAGMGDPAWLVAGVGDFNGDARPDLLWRHADTGEMAVGYLDGLTPAGRARVSADAEPGWRIAGIGDFNGDGKPDILWQDTATGAVTVWYMDGPARVGIATLPGEADLAWRIMRVAEVREGKTDLFWRHVETGENRVWHLDGITLAGVEPVAAIPEMTFVLCP